MGAPLRGRRGGAGWGGVVWAPGCAPAPGVSDGAMCQGRPCVGGGRARTAVPAQAPSGGCRQLPAGCERGRPGGRHRQAGNRNPRLMAQLPAPGPGDVGQPLGRPLLSWPQSRPGAVCPGAVGSVTTVKTPLYSVPGALGTDRPAWGSRHNPGSRDDVPISQMKKRGCGQVPGLPLASLTGSSQAQAHISVLMSPPSSHLVPVSHGLLVTLELPRG